MNRILIAVAVLITLSQAGTSTQGALPPKLATDTWPRSRLEKAYRNYAMEYVRSALPVMVHLFGPHDAGHLLHLTGRLIGMQFYPEIAASLPQPGHDGPRGFGEFLLALLHASGDEADMIANGSDVLVTQPEWALLKGTPDYDPACLRALTGLVEGLMDACDRRLILSVAAESSETAGPLIWTVRPRRVAPADDGRFPA